MTQVELRDKFADEINRELFKACGSGRVLPKAAVGRIMDFLARTIITDLLLEGKGFFPGLGIFSVVERAPRACINPQTKKSIGVKPAYKAIKFKPYKEIKEQIKGV